MKGPTAAAVDNSRLTLLIMAVIAVAGVWTYLDFPSREDPEITIREAVVTVMHPGMSPERMEALIVRRLEEEIAQMPEVEDIVSTVRTGVAIIHVHLLPRFFDLDPVWQDLRNRVEDAREDLPPETLGPFVNDDFGDVAVASLALTGEGFTAGEMRRTARDIREQLYRVEGVERIEMHGVRQERIYLETTDARLAQFDVPPLAIIATLQDQNIILPGGEIEADPMRIVVQPTGYFESIDEIANLEIAVPGVAGVVLLRDLADVRLAPAEPPERVAYFNGREAIVLAVTMLPGENVLNFGPRLMERARAIERTLPDGFAIGLATYQPEPVERAIDDVTSSLYQTLAIVLLVVVLFLGLREGLIVGAMIPLTMLGALIVMRLIDIELQRVSLASMIISLGMLVSNFVAVAEDIERRIREGEERREAAVAAGNSLALPLLAATLTTVLAFTPPLLAVDEAGEYTRSLSIVIAITLLGSWLLALTATPLLCMRFIKGPEDRRRRRDDADEDEDEHRERPLYRYGRPVLIFLLRIRWIFVVAMVAVVILAAFLTRYLPEQFFPESERAELMIELDLPAGYSSEETDRTVREILAWLGDEDRNPEVERTVGYVGFGGPRFFLTVAPRDPAPHIGFIVVGTHSFEQSVEMIERTREHLLANHPEVRARLIRPFLGHVETGLVELRLSGPERERLSAMGRHVESELARMPDVIDIRNTWENRIVKAVVEVDQTRARRNGITSADVAASLDAYFEGQTITPFYDADTLIPILLRAEPDERATLDRLRTVSVYSASNGTSVPLLQIADITTELAYGRLDRRNQEATLTVAARHRDMTATEFEAHLVERLPFLHTLPDGYTFEWGGETEAASDARTEVFGYAPYALAAIVVVLVWQFNSFRRPLIVVLGIPLAFAGGVGGLFVTGSWFGFMAILGFISLGGVIVNYAILIIDRIDAARAEGREPFEAVIEGTLARTRAVLMMGLTTILGLTPLIVWRDVLFYDMANVIAFGLAFGMLTALGLVPVLYAILFGIGPPEEPEHENGESA